MFEGFRPTTFAPPVFYMGQNPFNATTIYRNEKKIYKQDISIYWIWICRKYRIIHLITQDGLAISANRGILAYLKTSSNTSLSNSGKWHRFIAFLTSFRCSGVRQRFFCFNSSLILSISEINKVRWIYFYQVFRKSTIDNLT